MGTAVGNKKSRQILEYERLSELAAAEAKALTKDTIHTPLPPLPPLEAAVGVGAIQTYA